MAEKNRDQYQHWRCHTIGFRMSPEESAQLDIAVKLSGLTKQEYVCNRCLEREIVVRANPRVFKALKDQMGEVLGRLQEIATAGEISPELFDTIQMIAVIMDGLKGGSDDR